MTFAYFNLFGVAGATAFVLSWRPPQVIYRVALKFVRLLVDAGNFDAVEALSQKASSDPYVIAAIALELLKVGRFPNANALEPCLALLGKRSARLRRPAFSYEDTTTSALMSFLEACAARNMSKTKILRVLGNHISKRAPRYFCDNIQKHERYVFLRAVALRSVLARKPDPNIEGLLPRELANRKGSGDQQDVGKFKEVLGALLPWHMLRTGVLLGVITDVPKALKDADKRSTNARALGWRDADSIPHEICQICCEILTFFPSRDGGEIERYSAEYLGIFIYRNRDK